MYISFEGNDYVPTNRPLVSGGSNNVAKVLKSYTSKIGRLRAGFPVSSSRRHPRARERMVPPYAPYRGVSASSSIGAVGAYLRAQINCPFAIGPYLHWCKYYRVVRH